MDRDCFVIRFLLSEKKGHGSTQRPTAGQVIPETGTKGLIVTLISDHSGSSKWYALPYIYTTLTIRHEYDEPRMTYRHKKSL